MPERHKHGFNAVRGPDESDTKNTTVRALAATCQVCKNCEAYFPKTAKSCPSCGTSVA